METDRRQAPVGGTHDQSHGRAVRQGRTAVAEGEGPATPGGNLRRALHFVANALTADLDTNNPHDASFSCVAAAEICHALLAPCLLESLLELNRRRPSTADAAAGLVADHLRTAASAVDGGEHDGQKEHADETPSSLDNAKLPSASAMAAPRHTYGCVAI